MGVCSTVDIKSSATLVANLTLKGTSAFPDAFGAIQIRKQLSI
ncbi:hypothetical protein T12_16540 [Trichinella patagoniensis]|uniref:Uncharacterized protein n=1 Tax=Trichinella patagoniensis TaxID=990121 RepID=A0A0V0Y7S7_9BILA|nr:hypothetical protein T12_16540 [Trichinella patagoniensis]